MTCIVGPAGSAGSAGSVGIDLGTDPGVRAGGKLLTQRGDVAHRNPDHAVLAAVAGVLRQVQHSLRSRDLHIRRQPGLELVLPVQGEAQVLELARQHLPGRHHPQHRNGRPG
jgi:hypothetical protein